MSTNITTAHREAFQSVRYGSFTNFALFSCFVNGKPAAAIVSINPDGDKYNSAAFRQRHEVGDPHGS